MKPKKKSIKECPQCGGETIIETVLDFHESKKIRRCDSLVEIGEDKPLEACLWSEDIHPNGKPVKQ